VCQAWRSEALGTHYSPTRCRSPRCVARNGVWLEGERERPTRVGGTPQLLLENRLQPSTGRRWRPLADRTLYVTITAAQFSWQLAGPESKSGIQGALSEGARGSAYGDSTGGWGGPVDSASASFTPLHSAADDNETETNTNPCKPLLFIFHLPMPGYWDPCIPTSSGAANSRQPTPYAQVGFRNVRRTQINRHPGLPIRIGRPAGPPVLLTARPGPTGHVSAFWPGASLAIRTRVGFCGITLSFHELTPACPSPPLAVA